MSSWIETIADGRPIAAIFGGAVPSLDNVELVELVVNQYGPGLRLK